MWLPVLHLRVTEKTPVSHWQKYQPFVSRREFILVLTQLEFYGSGGGK